MKPETQNTLPTVAEKGEIVLYQPNESIRLEVRIEDETVWLTRLQMAELFGRDVKTIGKHVNNALKEELSSELLKFYGKEIKPVVAKFATTALDGKVYQTEHYSIDVILSVGYRVKSAQGIIFRAWANEILKNHIIKGFSINQHLISLQEHFDNRFSFLESRVDNHEQKIDFLIQKEQPVTEQLFSTGCVWDAYTFVSNLVRSAS
ncbi:MAG: virulence RhuM family protein, partial [Bacteroidales bacterium]|nr:virulence RhuM family protein [Bacteroidales bacterium]